MPKHNRWGERYVNDDLPWDTGCPDTYLVRMVSRWPLQHGTVLEVGCGTGTNSIWLAEQGFEVIGVDLAEEAVAIAEKRAIDQNISCQFMSGDFLTVAVDAESQQFIFDRGCFHSVAELQRPEFVARAAELLVPGGLWLSMIGNADDAFRHEGGPPRLSALHIAEAMEPHFEIVHLESCLIESRRGRPPRFWQCLVRKRKDGGEG